MELKRLLMTFNDWLGNVNLVKSSLITSFIVIVARLLVYVLSVVSGNNMAVKDIFSWGKAISVFGNDWIDTLVFLPFLNTLMFHTAFFEISKRFKIKSWVIVLFSSLIFCILRCDFSLNLISCFVSMAIFMYVYTLRAHFNKRPILVLVMCHFIINSIYFCLQ